MESTKYFSDSWKLVTRDKGWIKPILVMAAASMVPFVGYLGNKGYMLECARLTAWGVDAAPKQKNVDVTACIKSGWRGFVVELGLGLLLSIPVIVLSIIVSVLPDTLATIGASLVQLITSFYSLLIGVVVCAAQLRAAIYESIGAGYKFQRIKELIQRDTHGLTKVLLVQLVGGIILGFAIGIFMAVIMIPLVPTIISLSSSVHSGYASDSAIALAVAQSLVWLLPFLAVMIFVVSLLSCLLQLVVFNAMGLWMRQFNVPNWGSSDDPLPQNTPDPNHPHQYQAQQPPYQQPYQQQPYQQQPYQQQQNPASARPSAAPVVIPVRTTKPEAPAPKKAKDDTELIEAIPLARKPAEQPAPTPEPEPIPASEPATVEIEKIELPAQEAPTEVLPTKDEEDEPTVEDLYNDLSEAIKENDHVPEDDE